MELVARRQATVARIGEEKHRDGRALRDYVREREVIERGVRHAEALGMPGHIARDILQRLIHHSLSNQEQRRLVKSEHGAGHRALVIDSVESSAVAHLLFPRGGSHGCGDCRDRNGFAARAAKRTLSHPLLMERWGE